MFKKSLSLALLIASFTIVQAQGAQPSRPLSPNSVTYGYLNNPLFSVFSGKETYQIGSEWGKKPVTGATLHQENQYFQRMAFATAKVGGATGFYLGKFAGRHLMATNYHVFESAFLCIGNQVYFPVSGIRAKCTQFYGSWSNIDLALFEVEFRNDQDAAQIEGYGKSFSFSKQVYRDQPLVTMGFGVAENSSRLLMANKDEDCRVFSNDGEYHFMGDPDTINPSDYQAWSFANGCDVSHGDSGSAMMDRSTGEIVGIIWTGRIPKSEAVQNSAYIRAAESSNSPIIWEELSFAVPAVKIAEHFSSLLADPSSGDALKEVLGALLQPVF